MRFSIVICTYNRAYSLKATLKSLRYLRSHDFEVIVVNGPSTDATDELLASYGDSIRTGVCRERNLSVSRNIGIAMARGDIIALLDDDAVPDEYWLRDLGAGYDAPDIAGVGGIVYDHTGYRQQYTYCSSDRLGNPLFDETRPMTDYCYPGAPSFPYLQGTNASFRRDVMMEIGGFDEEFDYHLDETDVCLRIIDAGYRLRQIPGGWVYHRSLPSFVRNADRIVTHWFPIIKNKVYFALKNACQGTNFRAIMQDAECFILRVEKDLRWHVQQGNVGREVLDRFYADAPVALREGVLRGLTGKRRFLMMGPSDDPARMNAARFRLFPALKPSGGKLTVCLLSREYPPPNTGATERFTWELALGLAEAGHAVHVLTRSELPESTVDFDDGIWIHRVADEEAAAPEAGSVRMLPHLWRQSEPIGQELIRVHMRHTVDIVEAPLGLEEFLAEADSIRGLLAARGICQQARLPELGERHEAEGCEVLAQLEKPGDELQGIPSENEELNRQLAEADSIRNLLAERDIREQARLAEVYQRHEAERRELLAQLEKARDALQANAAENERLNLRLAETADGVRNFLAVRDIREQSRLAEVRERHEAERRELLAQLQQARDALLASAAEKKQLNLLLAETKIQLGHTQNRLHSLRKSFSWKLTSPLREARRGALRAYRFIRPRPRPAESSHSNLLQQNTTAASSPVARDQIEVTLTEPARSVYRALREVVARKQR